MEHINEILKYEGEILIVMKQGDIVIKPTEYFDDGNQKGKKPTENEIKSRFFGNRVKSILGEKNMSQQELADLMGIDIRNLKRYLLDDDNSNHRSPSHVDIIRIGMSLGLNREELNSLLIAGNNAPLKSYKTLEGDDVILANYDTILDIFEKISKDTKWADKKTLKDDMDRINREFCKNTGENFFINIF
jgi:transcriptional regulator with XRE-family HTH domain